MNFTAHPGSDSRTGWQGHGWGSTQVTVAAHDLWLMEQGHFRPAAGRSRLAFSNTYHWQRMNDCLRLFHERFGRMTPVWLLDMVPKTRWRLVGRGPHLCGADRYHATLDLVGRDLDLYWTILGPGKEEHLTYHYRRAAEAPRS